jgi:hypothetical protein
LASLPDVLLQEGELLKVGLAALTMSLPAPFQQTNAQVQVLDAASDPGAAFLILEVNVSQDAQEQPKMRQEIRGIHPRQRFHRDGMARILTVFGHPSAPFASLTSAGKDACTGSKRLSGALPVGEQGRQAHPEELPQVTSLIGIGDNVDLSRKLCRRQRTLKGAVRSDSAVRLHSGRLALIRWPLAMIAFWLPETRVFSSSHYQQQPGTDAPIPVTPFT